MAKKSTLRSVVPKRVDKALSAVPAQIDKALAVVPAQFDRALAAMQGVVHRLNKRLERLESRGAPSRKATKPKARAKRKPKRSSRA